MYQHHVWTTLYNQLSDACRKFGIYQQLHDALVDEVRLALAVERKGAAGCSGCGKVFKAARDTAVTRRPPLTPFSPENGRVGSQQVQLVHAAHTGHV